MSAAAADAGARDLHPHLDALESALQAGEIGQAADALDAFEAALRAWLPSIAHGRHADALQALLDRQLGLLTCMQAKQEEAATALRILEQSRRAAGAYRTSMAEMAP